MIDRRALLTGLPVVPGLTAEQVRTLYEGRGPELTVDPWCKQITTWIPYSRNPSKLKLHRWDGRQWHDMGWARFVPLENKP